MSRTVLLFALAAALAAGEAPATVRVPLTVFGIATGTEVSIDGKATPAEAEGLPLPPGRAVTVAWKANGREQSYPVTTVTAATGDLTPAWYTEGPRQDGAQQIVVGHGIMSTVPMARDRAINDARMQAMYNSPATTTTVTDKEEVSPDGKTRQGEHITRRHIAPGASVSSEIRDLVILVSTDAKDARCVTCWVRIAATVTVGKSRPEMPGERKTAAPVATGTTERGEAKDPAAAEAEAAAKREAEEAAKRKAAAPAR